MNVEQEQRQALVAHLRGWAPAGCGISAAWASLDYPVHPEELALVRGAVPGRRAEFVTGRWCAHRALEQIGQPAEQVGVGQLGAPAWPDGVLGTLTHEAGLCIALVTGDERLDGIGIDLFDSDRQATLSASAALIATPDERERAPAHAAAERYFRLLFSAKEAVVKAVSRHAGRLLDLREVDIRLSGDVFTARVAGLPSSLMGHWSECGRFLLTLATLGRPSARPAGGLTQRF